MRAVDWFFRDRRTGRITIAQAPNATLWLFGIASLLDLLLKPSGALGTLVRGVATVSLIAWAADELLRGVNPWRRCLGAAVLAYCAASAFR